MNLSDYPNARTLDARVRLHEECSTNPYGWQRWVMDHITPHLSGQILEMGTGPGYLWVENTERVPEDIHLVLSDLSAGMLTDVRERVDLSKVAIDWLRSDIAYIPFRPATFNTVIANHLLFLVDDPGNCVGELARILHPGGSLFASTNHRDHLEGLLDLFLELDPDLFDPMFRYEAQERSERFNFVSGADHLMHHFVDVKLVTYEDSLKIDHADILEPWIKHWAKPGVKSDRRADLLLKISERIAQEGGLHIRKNSGMFIAVKGE
jgi:SAM-dependent methyltransferase